MSSDDLHDLDKLPMLPNHERLALRQLLTYFGIPVEPISSIESGILRILTTTDKFITFGDKVKVFTFLFNRKKDFNNLYDFLSHAEQKRSWAPQKEYLPGSSSIDFLFDLTRISLANTGRMRSLRDFINLRTVAGYLPNLEGIDLEADPYAPGTPILVWNCLSIDGYMEVFK